ncbi:virulence protein [Hymenobacter terrenus]|uniref:virulence protein n=1 Tax=Hymenobacter terrenus TaxID=1629124 RepID=UPI000619D495|nr:virulence protein [Hymenobacter terrenus]
MESTDNILLYQAPDGQTRLEVQLDHETVWLTQAQMAQLFDRERSVLSKHLRTVFQTGELDEESNVHFLHIAFSDKAVSYYNLDVIISVGYRASTFCRATR